MIYTEKTKKALELCLMAHDGQKDKAGFPYFMHPVWVAEQMGTENECCTALLHDVVEDSDLVSLDHILEDFGDVIADAVEALTRREDESYLDYLKRVEKNSIALRVKLADLKHNTNEQRVAMSNLSPSLLDRYQKALKYLTYYE